MMPENVMPEDMKDEIASYKAFAENRMMPAALATLKGYYERYIAGEDIAIETKADQTPASAADRETERVLRDLIHQTYPDHGIVGEEFGAENSAADFVWVLDPLDGTKEFLAKNPEGFGCLIALLYQGRPVVGLIGDMTTGQTMSPIGTMGQKGQLMLADVAIACTNPEGMFPEPTEQAAVQRMIKASKGVVRRLNCHCYSWLAQEKEGMAQMGQEKMVNAKTAKAKVGVAIEQDLALHDIAAIIPFLKEAGVVACDLSGRSWYDQAFDLKEDLSAKYGILAALNDELLKAAFAQWEGDV